MEHKALDELFEIDDVLNHTQKSDELFLQAMKEAFNFHYTHNEVYKNICDDENFSIDNVKTIEDLSYIPHLLVDIFKWYKLLSLPKEDLDSEAQTKRNEVIRRLVRERGYEERCAKKLCEATI